MQSLLACFSVLVVILLLALAEETVLLRVGMFEVLNTDPVGGPEDMETEVGSGRTDVTRSSAISI